MAGFGSGGASESLNTVALGVTRASDGIAARMSMYEPNPPIGGCGDPKSSPPFC
jgi:hypothetical protein